ncbi:MAG: N-acetyl-gamma-glutamyl-phosphate reductase [Aigarchaeota archaeon]|nr:N-acetyl-gamma-glutamyl-phosphate reductase [Aigarchaeota archaeon]MCX8192488.1 N-acetyl-gamma-glutamyl-phosphate reductase [Nitrososphaeria archaeon]MDW7985776.1 N-acetyl-gamma-glutamyl-phosphate reductase [Nitrososphaerota archaeon]
MIRVGIVGASGYTGGELLRLLALHPSVQVTVATSREFTGKPISYVHINLRRYYPDLKFTNVEIDALTSRCDLVFINTPPGISQKITPNLIESGLKIVDLSPDFRLKNIEEYRRWYQMDHEAVDLLSKAVYGLPEIHRDEIKNAELIACPGCNSTASILALTPLIESNIIDKAHIIIDVKAGSSEAGRKPNLGSHHPERANAMRPYSVEGHRHVAEILQELSLLSKEEIRIMFVPHAVGAVRGALATCYTWLTQDDVDENMLRRIYAKRYGREPFVRIVGEGLFKYPDPVNVVGSNYADVKATQYEKKGVIAFCAIDNLIKGAAGQAIQCMNILLKIDEKTGLEAPPLRPI